MNSMREKLDSIFQNWSNEVLKGENRENRRGKIINNGKKQLITRCHISNIINKHKNENGEITRKGQEAKLYMQKENSNNDNKNRLCAKEANWDQIFKLATIIAKRT